jgi:hypothetical protein
MSLHIAMQEGCAPYAYYLCYLLDVGLKVLKLKPTLELSIP